MQPHEKTAILKGLKAEEAARFREQDTYRAILKDIEAAPQTEGFSGDFDALSWERIENHMEGECWPPTSQDWWDINGLDFDETPKQILLDQITDTDIRFRDGLNNPSPQAISG